MTKILSQSEVAAIRERAAKATPGPWRWRYCHGGRPMLAHPGHGMLVVLDAVRDGMNGAQLRFAKRNPNDMGGLLYKASDLLERPGLGVPDFQDADNPDMAFIAASRTDAVALCDTVDALRAKLEVAKAALEKIVLRHFRIMTDWFDKWDAERGNKNSEVQRDLRAYASAIESALAQLKEPQ